MVAILLQVRLALLRNLQDLAVDQLHFTPLFLLQVSLPLQLQERPHLGVRLDSTGLLALAVVLMAIRFCTIVLVFLDRSLLDPFFTILVICMGQCLVFCASCTLTVSEQGYLIICVLFSIYF